MFVYGVCIGTEAKYQQYAKASLDRHAPGATVLERRDQTSIFNAYNSILHEASAMKDVEGVVLLHEDVELRAPIEETLRRQFANPRVGIVGAIGGRGVRSVRWAASVETFGYAPDAFHGDNDHGRGEHDVDIVDGLLLALSPWVSRNLAFDENAFSGFHGYDADISMHVRAAGRIVRVADFDLFHHTKGGFGDLAGHRRTDDTFRKKWDIPKGSVLYRLQRRVRGLPY